MKLEGEIMRPRYCYVYLCDHNLDVERAYCVLETDVTEVVRACVGSGTAFITPAPLSTGNLKDYKMVAMLISPPLDAEMVGNDPHEMEYLL